ncbi:hypothetical protein HPP92_017344 [Vanilla planifolia]|uniref:Inositol polyphosphate-related phosphatase domain-containing protein n=1 Tax=Vanilla planifolia TaxID=51239 RepID=A0A835QC22_VANPL|nr:hypothetical protein HPP92_017344 [Vanilla planifolia]
MGYDESSMSQQNSNICTLSIFVATWNVGGKHPFDGLKLDFLQADDDSDLYILGFQEIVPLNAGHVLVIEDAEPAVKWLGLINQALNTPSNLPSDSFAQGSQQNLYLGTGKSLKSCNCSPETPRKSFGESCFRCPHAYYSSEDDSEEDNFPNGSMITNMPTRVNHKCNHVRYSLIASKQMVGIFVTVWAKRELVSHIAHLRISCIGRGVMGYLGNKGCISVSMTLYRTSFCFICSHLASGEKEGDELRRNSDVIEILKNTEFRKMCKHRRPRVPSKILEHDRIIWFGDLNYRIALSYFETNKLLLNNEWDALLEKDQLKTEREAGRVFEGWNEGKIYFAPTYKYSFNSDAYAGQVAKSKKKRRTPAWCDRILWHGDGITQLSYIRGESRLSDHRPVSAGFRVDVAVLSDRTRKCSSSDMRIGVEELLPPNTSSSTFCRNYSPNLEQS